MKKQLVKRYVFVARDSHNQFLVPFDPWWSNTFNTVEEAENELREQHEKYARSDWHTDPEDTVPDKVYIVPVYTYEEI